MIPIESSNNRLLSEKDDGDIISSKRETTDTKTCFICNSIFEKEISIKNILKKENYQNFINVDKRISAECDINSLIDNQHKLYSVCLCDKVAHVKCLLKLCIIKVSLSCSRCNNEYNFYFEDDVLSSKERLVYYSKLFFFFLLILLMFAATLILFSLDFDMQKYHLFWKYIIGILIIFLNVLLIISLLNCLTSLFNKTYKTRIAYSENKPITIETGTVSENSKKFHYYIKKLFGVEIGNQFKGKVDFTKFINLEINNSSSYWNTLEQCNFLINQAKCELEGEEDYTSHNKKKNSKGFKSPTKQFKRGASGLKGVNRQFSKSPSVSKKVSPPLNINLSPKLVKEDFSLKLQPNSNQSKKRSEEDRSPSPMLHSMDYAGEEDKGEILLINNQKSNYLYNIHNIYNIKL